MRFCPSFASKAKPNNPAWGLWEWVRDAFIAGNRVAIYRVANYEVSNQGLLITWLLASDAGYDQPQY